MKFEKLIEDGRLWAAQYEGDDYNAFDLTFSQWTDVKWLKDFFESNYIKAISLFDQFFYINHLNSFHLREVRKPLFLFLVFDTLRLFSAELFLFCSFVLVEEFCFFTAFAIITSL